MSRRFLYLTGLSALLGLGGLVWTFVGAQPAPREVVRKKADVVFATHGDDKLCLDYALPAEGDGPFPAVICLHGGGWVGGDRKQMAATMEVFTRRGFVAVSVDYRLAPKNRFPACLHDVKSAVRWLRANSADLRVNPDRIGVMGLSAGAHLAALMGVTHGVAELEGTSDATAPSSRVNAVVGMATPCDLTDPFVHQETTVKKNLVPLLGVDPKTDPAAYRKASPISYRPKNAPPFLLIQGDEDPVLGPKQAETMASHLRTNCGGAAGAMTLEGAGHTWSGLHLRRGIDRMLTFFDETLKP